MNLQLSRMIPIAKDIGTQLSENPGRQYVFFYDDGPVFRAFACERVLIGKDTVSAMDSHDLSLAIIPKDTTWRLVHKSNLDFVSGLDIEEMELRNFKVKCDLQKRLLKELGLDQKIKDIDDVEVPDTTKHLPGMYI